MVKDFATLTNGKTTLHTFQLVKGTGYKKIRCLEMFWEAQK